MASATVPTTPTTRKRTPPSPQRVYETWQHECRSAGEWGAYARTAARYHKPSGEPYSDEWARKLCKRWEAEQLAREAAEAAPVDDTLAYQPPPGGYPQPQPAAVLRQANLPTSTLKAPTIGADLPTGARDITAAANGEVANSQPANPANSQPFELEETHRREDAHRQTGSAERPEQPQRQGEPYDGTYGSGEMEPKRGGVPRSPSGYDQLEERPAREIPEERPQPSGIPRSPSGGEQPEEQPRQQASEHPRPVPLPPGPPEPEPNPSPDPDPVPTPPLYRPERVIVRVPEQRQVGGLVGWLATGPMLGPVPVWALLLLGFGALLVQLGLLG